MLSFAILMNLRSDKIDDIDLHTSLQNGLHLSIL